jgi:hypothetical protein
VNTEQTLLWNLKFRSGTNKFKEQNNLSRLSGDFGKLNIFAFLTVMRRNSVAAETVLFKIDNLEMGVHRKWVSGQILLLDSNSILHMLCSAFLYAL